MQAEGSYLSQIFLLTCQKRHCSRRGAALQLLLTGHALHQTCQTRHTDSDHGTWTSERGPRLQRDEIHHL